MVDKNTDTFGRMQGIFKYLVKEEVRFHTELFGLSRFIGFPLFIVALVSAGLFGAMQLGLGSVEDVITAVHGLFFLLALQIGSVAFMADDAASDLLGGRSTLLYSHTYLPVTQQTLVVLFAIKDVLFYLGLFVLPTVLAAAAFLSMSLPQVLILLISLTLIFALGIGFSLFLASLGLKSRSQSITLTIMLVASLTVLFTQTPLEITSVIFYSAPTPTAQAIVALGLILATLGFSVFSARNIELSREADQRLTYTWLIERILNVNTNSNKKLTAIVGRTFSDVFRSGGGAFKIGFTIAVLIGMTAYLLDILHQTTAIQPNYTITTAVIIALASYANYVWIFQNDSLEEYKYLPLTSSDVKSAKRYAFHCINTGILLLTVLITGIVFESSVYSIIGTGALVIGISEFYFQFTFALANYEPMDFLFDTARFSFFSVVLMALFIPLLVVGLFGTLFMTGGQILVSMVGASLVFFVLSRIAQLFT